MIPPSPSSSRPRPHGALPLLLLLGLLAPAARGFVFVQQQQPGAGAAVSGRRVRMMSTTEPKPPVVPKVGAPMPEGTCVVGPCGCVNSAVGSIFLGPGW